MLPIYIPFDEKWFNFDSYWNALATRIHKDYGMSRDPLNVLSFRRKRNRVEKDIWFHYNEPHRHYHNVDHVIHCLKEFQEARHLAENPNVVEFSLFEHDVIYDPRDVNGGNEGLSAELAVEHCRELGFPEVFAEKVSKFVRATAHLSTNHVYGSNRDIDLILDIDLAILGQSEEIFEEYNKGIEKEYSWVKEKYGEEFYRERRAKVLEKFLKKKPLYLTDHFRDKYEEKAKENLHMKVTELTKKS